MDFVQAQIHIFEGCFLFYSDQGTMDEVQRLNVSKGDTPLLETYIVV
jgi:hypothetical protein